MSVVGCEYRLLPGDAEIDPGDSVTISLEAYNCGTENGAILVDIGGGGGGCNNNQWLDPYTGTVECAYTIVMPEYSILIVYNVSHWIGDSWHTDWSYTATLTPTAPADCTQYFTVKDEDSGNLIDPDSLTVDGTQATRISKGRYSIVLITGEEYEAVASKSGYYTGHWYITACGDDLLEMEKIVSECGQYINVTVSAGEETDFKLEWGDGIWEVGTTPQRCYYDYEEGITVTAIASAVDYEPDSRTFTTCTSEFTLTLAPEFGWAEFA